MNQLRLNVVNLHAPYRVWQKSGKPNHYYFVTDTGVEFKVTPCLALCDDDKVGIPYRYVTWMSVNFNFI